MRYFEPENQGPILAYVYESDRIASVCMKQIKNYSYITSDRRGPESVNVKGKELVKIYIL